MCDPVETLGKCEAGERRGRVMAMTFFLEPGSPPLDCQSQNKCVLGTGWIIKINGDVEGSEMTRTADLPSVHLTSGS